ncbi:pyridoxamine 5'-phosphate oxidase family protein [Streptomyces sp. TLI_185]|uniref:pyridoxamine 5'-phosphate oxidase family protein n=1 Tax=Streptomyces sp. TLI_185 TaxID=2485151 RepID=UPI000F514CFF|nr:pyridoxamine 5'-phosphate oxidase family protein [Streptomyces sp. TLI_185]RPF33119.1 pyridoxamine 5'-phosphate oxidase [Streptomyces sp. TLI_185]
MNPGDIVRGIVDANLYLVLATADADGRPWSSPVYFAHEEYREFFWISSPDARHSRNIAVRSEVGISVFDSSVAISTGQGVYMSATAARADGPDVERGLDVFSRRSVRHGGRVWTAGDVGGDSGMRLYRAVADDHSILAKDGRPDHRIPVDLGPA